MSLSHPVRIDNNKQYHSVVEKLPTVTLKEQLRRVAEWTKKTYPQRPPKYEHHSLIDDDHDPKEKLDNPDFEAQSELIVEGVRMMDSRDHLIASAPPTAKDDEFEELIFDRDDMQDSVFDDGEIKRMGKSFYESKLPAKTFVKEFEHKVNQRKIIDSAIFNTYPYIKPHNHGVKGKTLIPAESMNTPLMISARLAPLAEPSGPVVEPDAWRYKATRSIQFSMKYPHTNDHGKDSNIGNAAEQNDVPDEKWSVKQENDKDWWKWKLKQRFLENDMLLQKLVDQREKLESTFVRPGAPIPKSFKELGKPPSASPSSVKSYAPFNRNTSRHVTVEFTQLKPNESAQQTPVTFSKTRPSGKVTKDPIPHFYDASKEARSEFKSDSVNQDDPTSLLQSNAESSRKQQKLQTLKKDPYLAKLLNGNEMFKPEIMLEASQSTVPKAELSRHHHHHKEVAEYGNPRRKISLESLTDSSDDDNTAAKFFNPDVKVLYERLSDLETEAKGKSAVEEGFSREPSDGYLNLPILLATGRFNRYNKLPSMKGVVNNKASPRGVSAKGKKSKSGRIRSVKVQSISNKMKRDHFIVSKMGTLDVEGIPKVFMGKSKSKIQTNNIESLSTKEWAKKLMQKMKQQNNSSGGQNKMDDETLTDSDDEVTNEDRRGRRARAHPVQGKLEDLESIQATKKYQVPIDQETNLLYHEILMSKWKKDKHENRIRDIETVGGVMGQDDQVQETRQKMDKSGTRGGGGHQKLQHYPNNRHKKEDDKIKKSNPTARPKGLDIWLENIREKAKRDRLISPLPNADTRLLGEDDDAPFSKATAPSLLMAFENTAFKM